MSSATKRSVDVTSFFQLQDIALWDSSFSRVNEYQPGLHGSSTRAQSRRGLSADMLEATAADGQKADILRVIVRFALRVVAAGDAADKEEAEAKDIKSDDILHEIEAAFAVSYLVVEQPDDKTLHEFISFNCVHNAWPFWRQHVFDVLKRASLPLIEVPLFSGQKATPMLSGDQK